MHRWLIVTNVLGVEVRTDCLKSRIAAVAYTVRRGRKTTIANGQVVATHTSSAMDAPEIYGLLMDCTEMKTERQCRRARRTCTANLARNGAASVRFAGVVSVPFARNEKL